jgi:hypothetical protein
LGTDSTGGWPQHNHIFRQFFREPTNRSRAGLSLNAASELVERYNVFRVGTPAQQLQQFRPQSIAARFRKSMQFQQSKHRKSPTG